MTDTPEWVLELCDEVLECIEGFTFFETQYYAPDENELECHLIEIAPAKLEIAEAGANDGEEIFDSSFDVDLLGLIHLFEKAVHFHSGMDFESNSRSFMMETSYGGREIYLLIHTVPFEDTQAIGRLKPGGKLEFFKDIDDA